MKGLKVMNAFAEIKQIVKRREKSTFPGGKIGEIRHICRLLDDSDERKKTRREERNHPDSPHRCPRTTW